MKKRMSVNSGVDRRFFTATAQKTHPQNVRSAPMRGGIRL